MDRSMPKNCSKVIRLTAFPSSSSQSIVRPTKTSEFLPFSGILKSLKLKKNYLVASRSKWAELAKRFGESSPVAGTVQFFMPIWFCKLFKLNFFKMEPFIGLGEMFSRMLKERKSDGQRYNDLSETIQDAIDKGLKMDEKTKVGNCLLGFLAGVETVSSALCQVAEYLVEYPEYQERLYQELKKEFSNSEITYENLTQHQYLDAFLNESMRLGTPALVIVKRAARDTKIGDIPIEKDTEILLVNYISHMSPENFPDPTKFDPERFMDKSADNPNKIEAGTFLPFSQGPRACVGKLLAILEMKYLLTTMLLKYKLKKPKDFKIEAQHFRGGMSFVNVPILFEERK